jgi:hypothetical protein
MYILTKIFNIDQSQMTYVWTWYCAKQSLYKWCYSRYSVANQKTDLVLLRFQDQLCVNTQFISFSLCLAHDTSFQ